MVSAIWSKRTNKDERNSYLCGMFPRKRTTAFSIISSFNSRSNGKRRRERKLRNADAQAAESEGLFSTEYSRIAVLLKE